MDSYDTDNFLVLAKKAEAKDAKMVYHPTIREIVRYLARRAAERDYEDQLTALAASGTANADTAGDTE